MTFKLQTILSTIFLVLVFTVNQCEATILDRAVVSIGNEDATMDTSPIIYSRIMIDAARHLNDQEVNVHKHDESPYFNIRMPWCLLACLIVFFFTYAVFLFTIPSLRSDRWNCYKSAFWVANSHVQSSAPPTEEYEPIIKSDGDEEQATNATVPADILTPSIACGMILATNLFLVIPEAILLIQRGVISSNKEEEIEIATGAICRFGAAVMAGFIIHPATTKFLTPTEDIELDKSAPSPDSPSNAQKTLEHADEINSDEEKNDDGDNSVIKEASIDSSSDYNALQNSIHSRLWVAILAGDITNNIFEGLFIGSAFMTCSTAVAVCVTIITIYTQLSRKFADYFLLTKYAGMFSTQALLLIFASGLAIFIGVAIIIIMNPGQLAVGCYLAIASGVYFHISASECLPRINSVVISPRDRWLVIGFFLFGALPIGLTLFQHGHCDE
eukprot:CAMPEP_0198252406 /NCGR_PEP_ID=MMETSP1447-20131203/2919_1 /TAXON_ID=420782 /ORGANISM="Chaetoceros dichaeta, Strain CCMP1751" /LENGTH=442 /DNA_ID=CAMNT_0043937657 /DNA_START=25 /DNA_END=1353 /DNA_ORIENTATION=-